MFLPVVLIGFYAFGYFQKTTAAITWLVVASLFFYGWWNPAYLALLGASILVNFFIGRQLLPGKSGESSKPLLIIGIIFNLGLLGYFKYANFFVSSFAALTGSDFVLQEIILPLAISFFTFQQIAYLADVYQRKVTEYSFLHYCLFVTFFPQLIAGPIVHHGEMMPQFMKQGMGRFLSQNLMVGLVIFMLGLFKKVMLADNVAVFATPVFEAADAGDVISFATAWIGALAYTLQIYFDFSGYSDMAIGLSRMFGIRLPLNFNSPYKSQSIVDFWRRWHMTLSRFLRDYLYIPLGGNRYGNSRRYVNLMLVMLIGGLWHGAGWTFVAWGGLHGSYLLINHVWRHYRGERFGGVCWRLFYQALTLLAVVVAWVFFRAETFAGATQILYAMAGGHGVDIRGFGGANRMAVYWFAVLIPFVLLLPNTQEIMRRYMDEIGYRIEELKGWQVRISFEPTMRFAISLAVISLVTVGSLWKASEFLYYQF